MRNYATMQGDMWDKIALRMYNSERLMHVLIDANPEYRGITVFPANCELRIPEVSREERVTFPPWRANS